MKGLGGKAKAKETLRTTKDGRVIKVREKAQDKLTDAAIHKLQNYFGIALRCGVKTVQELKNALLASFFHTASSELFSYHKHLLDKAMADIEIYSGEQSNIRRGHRPSWILS